MSDIQDYPSSMDNPASRKLGTFSYLPPMDAQRIRQVVDYITAQGWTPGVEHVEVPRSSDDYWYMWKLPMFGEKDGNRVLAEVEACRAAYPRHLVRVIGYDAMKQSLGTAVVVYRAA